MTNGMNDLDCLLLAASTDKRRVSGTEKEKLFRLRSGTVREVDGGVGVSLTATEKRRNNGDHDRFFAMRNEFEKLFVLNVCLRKSWLSITE